MFQLSRCNRKWTSAYLQATRADMSHVSICPWGLPLTRHDTRSRRADAGVAALAQVERVFGAQWAWPPENIHRLCQHILRTFSWENSSTIIGSTNQGLAWIELKLFILLSGIKVPLNFFMLKSFIYLVQMNPTNQQAYIKLDGNKNQPFSIP